MIFKLRHLVLVFSLLVIVLNWKTILACFHFIWELFFGSSNDIVPIDFSLIDILLSSLLILALPVFTAVKRNFLNSKIDFPSLVITALLFFFIYAPLISPFHPDFQKDISVTKLLPPFRSITFLYKKNDKDLLQPEIIRLKKQIVKQSYDESIIAVEKVKGNKYEINGELFYAENSSFIYEDNLVKADRRIFIFGSDEFGRDIFSRIIYGTRVSLIIGLGAVIISFIVGLSFGFLSGYYGGIIGSSLNKITDMFLSFPVLFLIILSLALFGSSIWIVIIVLGFSGWMSLFKLVRTEVQNIKQKDFFISAKMIGMNNLSLLQKEILPIIIAPIVVNLVFQYGNVILAESALSFLGLGIGSDYPSWGSMIQQGQRFIAKAWWMFFFPGIFLFITLLAAQSFGKKIGSIINPLSV